MANTLMLAVDLPATPGRLYDMYLDPKAHAAFTGAPVRIAAKMGARFEAFGGALSGTILQVVPRKLIVQAWRSTNFARRDIDSTLILTFLPRGKGARIELTHVNVSAGDLAGVSEGWWKYYFLPWRAFLER